MIRSKGIAGRQMVCVNKMVTQQHNNSSGVRQSINKLFQKLAAFLGDPCRDWKQR
jgi:hypothetical protein